MIYGFLTPGNLYSLILLHQNTSKNIRNMGTFLKNIVFEPGNQQSLFLNSIRIIFVFEISGTSMFIKFCEDAHREIMKIG